MKHLCGLIAFLSFFMLALVEKRQYLTQPEEKETMLGVVRSYSYQHKAGNLINSLLKNHVKIILLL